MSFVRLFYKDVKRENIFFNSFYMCIDQCGTLGGVDELCAVVGAYSMYSMYAKVCF